MDSAGWLHATATVMARDQLGTSRAQSGQGLAEPSPRRPAQLPCTTATGVPQTAHGGGPSAASGDGVGELALLGPAGRVLGARHATSTGTAAAIRSTGPGARAGLRSVEHLIPVAPGVELADPSGLDRGSELAAVRVPTLVVEAPEGPVNPPPHAAHLARVIGSARLVTVPGMGHALPAVVGPPLAEVIARHTVAADAGEQPAGT